MPGNRKQVEFEIKAQLESFADLKILLDSASYQGRQATRDTYYDVDTNDLFKLGIFLRIRDEKNLQIKFNPDVRDFAHTTSDEYDYEWPLSDECFKVVNSFLGAFLSTHNFEETNILRRFDLRQFVTIEKTREAYTAQGITICLDEVKRLGLFVEIETLDPEQTFVVRELCKKTGLVNIEVGYVELFLRKHDYALYKKGRYILEGDKKIPTTSI